MGLFRRFASKPESSKQTPGSSTHQPESSDQAFGPSVWVPVVNARVDLIFLHGLTGHREKTWTATGEDEPWPKSLLSKDLPSARIISYGYDADVANLTRVAGQNTVREHARNLINDLTALRRDAVGRPIIFVVHSLGGLVCQDALLVSSNPNEEEQRDIVSSTCGIAFLGTPHAGSDLERFATAVANIVSIVKKPNKKLLQVLRSNSEILANIKNDFLTMVHRHLENRPGNLKPIRLHTFVEELPIAFLKIRVVEPDSAKIPGYNSDTIHADHMGMTKFNNADDPGYRKILDHSIALQYGTHLRRKFETMWPGVELPKSEPPDSAKQLCESSGIEDSLAWFNNSIEYRDWKLSVRENLWLHGEPGDGKTVIMSYILRSLLGTLPPGKSDLVSIFCSGNDSEEGVLTSIACQLLLKDKVRAKTSQYQHFILKLQLGNERPYFNHILWELVTTLRKANGKTVFIIDGIDKLGVRARSSFLDRFGGLSKEDENLSIKVLISSAKNSDIQNVLRHYSSIDREKKRRECLRTLEFQEWNAREIGIQEVEAAGRRFFGLPIYRDWVQSDSPSVLWLEGKPGSGKSTLTKFMVKELEKDTSLGQPKHRCPSRSSPQSGSKKWIFNNTTDKNVIIARFYYSFRGGNTQTSHELMLRSIVYQIWSNNSRLFPLIQVRYQELRNELILAGELKSVWGYNDPKWALESLHQVDFNLRVFIVVDGMDESNNDQRVDILEFLLGLATPTPKSNCIVKIFIASRPENNINSRLRPVLHHIKLQEVNKEDIRVFVEGWIKRMVLEGECEEETLLEVKEYIMEHSRGVFMWVTLVLKDLKRHIDDGGYSKSSLDDRLRSLPNELGGKDGFYRLMINSLVEKYNKNQEQQERGRRILAWVTFAERPISVIELRDALATPSKLEATELSTYVLEDNRPHQLEKAILSSCGGLAEVRDSHSGPIVQLIHQTAREFLLHQDKLAEPYYLEEVQGDTEIAMTCCRYIGIAFPPDFPLLDDYAEFPNVYMLGQHLPGNALLVYALDNFQTHLYHLGSNGEKIRDEFMNFVKLLIEWSNSYASLLLGQWIQVLKLVIKLDVDETSARLYFDCLLLYAAETNDKNIAGVLLSLRPDMLHIVAGQGIPVTTKQSKQPFLSFDAMDRRRKRKSSTRANSRKGGLMLLLNMGIPANLKDAAGRTPLSYAAGHENTGSVKLLLKNGADADLKDAASRTPLSYAAENGRVDHLTLLVDSKSANLDLKDATGRTPLSYAAGNGHEGSLELLLQDGADVDSNDVAGRTPLSYAAENGHRGSLDLLFSRGANINSKDSAGRTPLSYAAGNGHEDSLSMLLEHESADVNSEDMVGRTPLSYAAGNGHHGSLNLLLCDEGVDVNLMDIAGRTPLSYASGNGHEGNVNLLLQMADIDINFNDTASRTPLSYAAENWHEGCLQLLLLRSSNVEINLENTALLWGSIFQTGFVNVNMEDTVGRTALSYAAENGYESSVELLIENGADFKFKDAAGLTPLSYAAANGHIAVVRLLQSYITPQLATI
ncbi:hypothetical protein V501_06676 [Pseudogymnoascus sp. VKM F-4519 (FW-2642)]|nr:hypothetical protein V501_06676 [Pseudogymnoascus sp. VKM F-4519 (FW-2642)]